MSLTQINKAGLDEIALDHVFTIGASGNSAYTFQGEGLNGTVNNPTLYLTRGKTYRFENVSGAHPIRIQSTSGASGTAYNTGVTGNSGGAQTVIVEVQHDAPDVLYYQCTSHAAMNGILYITGALADGGVTTAKIADDAVIGAKIADGAVNADKIGSGQVTTAKLTNNAVTTTKIADSQITTAKINDDAVTSAKLASSSVDTNALGSEVVTTANIANNAVTTAKLASGAADVVNDTSPQLGGSLDTNGNNISFVDSTGTNSNRATFGTSNDLAIYHQNNVSNIHENGTGPLRLSTDEFQLMDSGQTKTAIYAAPSLAVSLNYNGNTKIQTSNTGATITGTCTATSFSGDGSNLTGISSVTVSNNVNNRIVTGDGSGNLNAEARLTFDGSLLTVSGYNSDNPVILDTDNGNGAHMRFQQQGSTTHYLGCGGGISMGDANDLAIRATDDILIGTGNSSTVKMAIYNTGEVAKPYQPMFQARNSSNSAITINAGTIPFQTVINNVGSCYNNSNYRFTAPVDGVYLFYVGWYVNSDTNHRVNLRINGSDFTTPYIAGYSSSMGSSIPTFSGCQFLKLSGNDYVDVYTTATFYPYGTHVGWGGYLLG